MSRERATGRILNVWTTNPGTTLTADATAGTTVLTVDDVSPFNGAGSDDGPGGTLQVGDQVVAYVDIDDDASTITLAAPLPTAVTLVSEDADVLVWNDLYNQLDTVQYAMVQPEGAQDQADAIEAVVSDVVEDLTDGDRGGPGESCELVLDGDEWEIVRVKGRPSTAKGDKFYDLDTFTVSVIGDQSIPLTHTPVPGSLHCITWGFNTLTHDEFTLDGSIVTIPDPEELLQVGDTIDFKYVYRGEAKPASGVEYVSDGWRYLQVSLTDAVDRSAVGFDDSAWAVGQAPFGSRVGTPYAPSGFSFNWPAAATLWSLNTALWLRRKIIASAGATVTVEARVDNDIVLFWNGTQIASVTGTVEVAPIPVPAELVRATNVLAVHALDDAATGPSDWSYLDVQVNIATGGVS